MKYIAPILLSLFALTMGKAQNLVSNPSFEDYTTCPTASGQIIYAFPWYDVTSTASVDYFHNCSSSGYGVPNHGSIGYQYPKTGNGYSGIWVFSIGTNYREYLQIQFINPLVNGECYQVEYYVNLFNEMKFAISSVDAHLSTTAISSTGTGDILNLIPQIIKFNSSPLNDTLAWVKISSIFIANGGEEYLTIGNFRDDANTDTINTGLSYFGSYYYIDDVSVIPIDSIIGGMPAFAGNDTLIMEGDSIFIGQEISNLNCNWYDINNNLIATNISGIYVQPDSTTIFYVEQNLCGNITYDTIVISVSPLGIEELKNEIQFSIYPNPNSGIFSIVPFDSKVTDINVQIIDYTGKLIFSENLMSLNHLFEYNLNLADGMYSFKITDNKSNRNAVKRIVILN